MDLTRLSAVSMMSLITCCGVFLGEAAALNVDFFVWLFALDAVETAARIGIRQERAAHYRQTKEGTRAMYDSVDEIFSIFRRGEPIKENWKDKLEEK